MSLSFDDKLQPLDSKILRKARDLEGNLGLRNWTIRDHKGLGKYGSLRNSLSRLKKKGCIESPTRGLFHLTAKGREFDDKLPHGGGAAWIRSLLEDDSMFKALEVHNLRLGLGAEGYYKREKGHLPWVLIPANQALMAEWSLPSNRRAKVLLFSSDRFQIMIACSNDPYPASVDGLCILSGDLGAMYRCLSLSGSPLPQITSWVVESWEWNRDSSRESFSGLNFAMEFRTFYNELARVYSKGGGVRVEKKESFNAPYGHLVERFLRRGGAV